MTDKREKQQLQSSIGKSMVSTLTVGYRLMERVDEPSRQKLNIEFTMVRLTNEWADKPSRQTQNIELTKVRRSLQKQNNSFIKLFQYCFFLI